jgi:hypothetical protein
MARVENVIAQSGESHPAAHRSRPRRPWTVVLLLCLASTLDAAEAHRGQAVYQQTVLPLLQEYCADCHSTSTSEDRWAFDGYRRYAELVADRQAWGKAQQLLKNHLMPPRGEPGPAQKQRQQLLDWIDNTVFYVDPERPDPGRTTLRRLNRVEYNNSVRDVLRVELRPAEQFPPDDTGYGFDNIGDVLSVSPLHVEKYLSAARAVASEVVRLGPPPRVGIELTADRLTVFAGTPDRQGNAVRLRLGDEQVGTEVHVPLASTYRVAVRTAGGKNREPGSSRLELLLDGQPHGDLKPSGSSSILVPLPEGNHRLALRLGASGQRPPADSASVEAESVTTISFLGISGPFTPLRPQVSDYLREMGFSRRLGLPILRLSGEDLDGGTGRTSLDTGRAWFASHGYRHAPVLIPEAGAFRVRFKVGAQQAGPEPVRFEVRLGDRTLGPFSVTAKSQREQWIETECELPAGQLDWQVWFVNEFKDAATGAERWFWLHEFTIEGPLDSATEPTREEVLDVLGRAGRRLFRRSLAAEERVKLAQLFDTSSRAEHSPLAALRVGLETLLLSPKFLYHPRPQPLDAGKDGTALIDEFALASRLSYFLWSSAPDDQLLELAERGALRARFTEQVHRLLQDPKSEALTANFAGQWLQLRDLELAAPDPVTFPTFDSQLAADMRRETESLFRHILRENRPVLEFLTADYSFVNKRLADHYGLAVPVAGDFERVSLAATPRCGVWTHASVLTITSHPTRTSPVKRGKWLLEQLLGSTPPPAPRDVPPLPDTRENESLSLRARLEQHRGNDACASCHAVMDPLGFALENYDAIGRWRSRDGDSPIEASGQLITGERFGDWSELRELLVREYRAEFLRCVTENLLTYALGRGVTYEDKLFVRSIVERSQSTPGGLQDLVLAVCESVPFQRMRVRERME